MSKSAHRRATARRRGSKVVRLSDYREPPQKSLYERYPLPFFNRDKLCTWDVTPSGDYSDDCKTGTAYAVEFLKSCDGTFGWSSLLAQIVAEIVVEEAADLVAEGFILRAEREIHGASSGDSSLPRG